MHFRLQWIPQLSLLASDYNAMLEAGIKFIREPKDEDYGLVAVFEALYGNLWDLFQPT